MTDDYKVGYKRPPTHTRWTKGQTGNPKGRAKGTKNLKTDLGEELAERIPIREGGKARKVSKQRALIKALTAKAVHGDVRASRLIIDMVHRHFHAEMPAEPETFLDEDDTAIVEAFLARTQKTNPEPPEGDER